VLRGPGRKTFQIQNHNRLLYNYPGALGVKNGWTSTTGGSFIGAAARGGRRYLVTVLAADPETWQMSAALLNWAFATPAGPHPGVGRLVTGPDPDGALIAATTPSAAVGGGGGGPGGPAPRVDATSASVGGGGGSDRSAVLIVVALMVLGAGGVGVAWYSVQRRRTALVGRADDPWQRRTNHWS
jgi:D-alanyl-D-alanine carboxypeptidase (penicillin-binding protein 5/6)